MQERLSFEYATVRIVPKVEREEFLNAGVILYCPSRKFLDAAIISGNEKFLRFDDSIDMEEVRRHLESFKLICEGRSASPIGLLDTASRFRWLTAARSTVVQTSRVHPGLCHDPAEKLQKLFVQLAL